MDADCFINLGIIIMSSTYVILRASQMDFGRSFFGLIDVDKNLPKHLDIIVYCGLALVLFQLCSRVFRKYVQNRGQEIFCYSLAALGWILSWYTGHVLFVAVLFGFLLAVMTFIYIVRNVQNKDDQLYTCSVPMQPQTLPSASKPKRRAIKLLLNEVPEAESHLGLKRLNRRSAPVPPAKFALSPLKPLPEPKKKRRSSIMDISKQLLTKVFSPSRLDDGTHNQTESSAVAQMRAESQSSPTYRFLNWLAAGVLSAGIFGAFWVSPDVYQFLRKTELSMLFPFLENQFVD